MNTGSASLGPHTDLAAAFDALPLEHRDTGAFIELTVAQTERIAELTHTPLREVECFALERGVVPSRYARSIGTFTFSGQKKLLQSQVLVVGLGGLGGHVVEQLARAGVGRITGVDPDIFDEQNLNRQILSTVGTLGQLKTVEAGRRLSRVNPAVEFSGLSVRFQQLADEAFANLDLVFDCLDTSGDRVVLAERCSVLGLPLVHAAIGGWYGQVGVCWPGSNMIARIYLAPAQGVEREMGNPPFTPAVAAGLMVARGIRLLLGRLSPPEQSLFFFDLLADDWETINFGGSVAVD
jgi:molybdopterin/thiamine biosynthesis adenylyltransferase